MSVYVRDADEPAVGPGIAVPDDAPRVSQFPAENEVVQPFVQYGPRFLFLSAERLSAEGAVGEYYLLDPTTGATAAGWRGEPDKQDIVYAADGDWLTTVRHGFQLPFAGWELILRNLNTGEARVIATHDTRVEGYSGQLGPGSGFAPAPTASNGRVAWTQLMFDDAAGIALPVVVLYSIADGSTATLFTADDSQILHVGPAAVSGDHVAWTLKYAASEPVVVLHSLSDGREVVWTLDGANPYQSLLVGDGEAFIWNEVPNRMYVLHVTDGVLVRMPVNADWPMASGRRVSWFGGFSGYYDIDTREIRYVTQPDPPAGGGQHGLGGWAITEDWLVLNYIRTSPQLEEMRELTAYVFVKLEDEAEQPGSRQAHQEDLRALRQPGAALRAGGLERRHQFPRGSRALEAPRIRARRGGAAKRATTTAATPGAVKATPRTNPPTISARVVSSENSARVNRTL